MSTGTVSCKPLSQTLRAEDKIQKIVIKTGRRKSKELRTSRLNKMKHYKTFRKLPQMGDKILGQEITSIDRWIKGKQKSAKLT